MEPATRVSTGDPYRRDLPVVLELWRAKAATSPRSLSAIVLSEPVVEAVRKELRRQTGHNCDSVELAKILAGDVLRADIS